MHISQFDYNLPKNLIAQTPIEPRHASRMMIVNRTTGDIHHAQFSDLTNYIQAGDMLIANDSRVIHARLFGKKMTGGKIELLLLKQINSHFSSPNSQFEQWEVIVGGKRLKQNVQFTIDDTNLQGHIVKELSGAKRIVEFDNPLSEYLSRVGHIPLPPYIHKAVDDPERYQTIYNKIEGSSAAPTAGLHFSHEMMLTLREHDIRLEYVTLHIGLDTFKPVTVEEIHQHAIHSEWASLSTDTAKAINHGKLAGKQIVAVGTTAVRTLETAALRSAGVHGSLQTVSEISAKARFDAHGDTQFALSGFVGNTDLFIYPGYHFRVVDKLLTNFHLPKSSILMLVSAFAGVELIREAYAKAIENKYRFYSFGDAMLII
ncbi:MAG: tRNA preQ1(34) S-adenosylmethionine ribosyltransferase-isomerase QueA [Anaerolineaceae bacterium 4572_78]|nr:MAG: tRNA preQ1(34) S-adenosylmethionine ribosyltransferase-isomerase QueA [Anaerolineaceae bacterium 4572_78]